MTKPIAVHFDPGRIHQYLASSIFLPCTGAWWYALDVISTTNPSEVTCRNCQRTKLFLDAIAIKFKVITGKPIKAPWPQKGVFHVTLNGRGLGTAKVVAMGLDVGPVRRFL